jgi:hypothetical protein
VEATTGSEMVVLVVVDRGSAEHDAASVSFLDLDLTLCNARPTLSSLSFCYIFERIAIQNKSCEKPVVVRDVPMMADLRWPPSHRRRHQPVG